MSYIPATIPVQHQVWAKTGTKDSHGNDIYSHGPVINRKVEAIYPLHTRPRPKADPVQVDYEARTIVDLLMDAPDATVYHKNDRVLIRGESFLVHNEPRNWGGDDPFGFDVSMFGGTIHLKRVG